MDTKQTRANNKELPYPIKVLFQLIHEIGLVVVLGFVFAFVLLFLFAELTEEIFAHEFSTFDNNFELWLHDQANPVLNVVFNFFTTLGGLVSVPILTALVFGLLIWRHKFYWAWLTVIAVAGGMAMNELLKAIFHRPRPELWVIRHQLTSYSYPSGHATASFCFFGLLAWIGIRYFKNSIIKVVWAILMVFIVVMVGLSRVYLGAHYPTDVIGGWISSALWLSILLNSAFFLKKSRKKSREAASSAEVENEFQNG